MSLMSYSEGSSTLKASVSRLRIMPSSCLSMKPDRSVSKVLKAVVSYFLAIVRVCDSYPDSAISIQIIIKYKVWFFMGLYVKISASHFINFYNRRFSKLN